MTPATPTDEAALPRLSPRHPAGNHERDQIAAQRRRMSDKTATSAADRHAGGHTSRHHASTSM
jgi:hypothetical protein